MLQKIHKRSGQTAVRQAVYLHSVYHQYTCFYAFLQAIQYTCYIYRHLAPCNVTQVYRYSTLLPVRAGRYGAGYDPPASVLATAKTRHMISASQSARVPSLFHSDPSFRFPHMITSY